MERIDSPGKLTEIRSVRIESKLQLEELPKRHWMLLAPVEAQFDAYDEAIGLIHCWITADEGFITDLATTEFMRGFLPSHGLYARAAVLHDWLYRHRRITIQLTGSWGGVRYSRDVTRAEADRIFRAALESLGVERYVRASMYAAVRSVGWWHWRKRSKQIKQELGTVRN